MVEKQVIDEFYKLQTCSDRRIQKIKNILKRSRKIIGKDLTQLKLIDITAFLKHLNDSSYTPWTKNDYKKIFKAFLKWQYKKEFLDWAENKNFKDGFKGVSKLRAFNKEKINKETLLKPEELERLLRTAKSLKLKAILTLLFETAFRPCEIVNLKWQDCKAEETRGVWVITTISPKTKEKRSIAIKDCIVHLKRWREEYEFTNRTEGDFVFPSSDDRTKHITEVSIGTSLRRLCEKAKMRNIYPYMFRHTRIYEIQKKMGARMSAKFGGHSLETSEIYNHLDDDDVIDEMLKVVYPTKELTPEEENKLKVLEKEIHKSKKLNELFMQFARGDISFDKEDNVFIDRNGKEIKV